MQVYWLSLHGQARSSRRKCEILSRRMVNHYQLRPRRVLLYVNVTYIRKQGSGRVSSITFPVSDTFLFPVQMLTSAIKDVALVVVSFTAADVTAIGPIGHASVDRWWWLKAHILPARCSPAHTVLP